MTCDKASNISRFDPCSVFPKSVFNSLILCLSEWILGAFQSKLLCFGDLKLWIVNTSNYTLKFTSDCEAQVFFGKAFLQSKLRCGVVSVLINVVLSDWFNWIGTMNWKSKSLNSVLHLSVSEIGNCQSIYWNSRWRSRWESVIKRWLNWTQIPVKPVIGTVSEVHSIRRSDLASDLRQRRFEIRRLLFCRGVVSATAIY